MCILLSVVHFSSYNNNSNPIEYKSSQRNLVHCQFFRFCAQITLNCSIVWHAFSFRIVCGSYYLHAPLSFNSLISVFIGVNPPYGNFC